MDYKKDNLLPSKHQETNIGEFILNLKHLIKKTEKIVAAVYMVTDLFDSGEPLQASLRSTSLKLLKSLYSTPGSHPVGKHVLLESIDFSISEAISYLEVTRMTALISEMNVSILQAELSRLREEIAGIALQNSTEGLSGKSFRSSGVEKLSLPNNLFTKDTEKLESKENLTENENPLSSKGHFYKGQLSDFRAVLYGKDSSSKGQTKGHFDKSGSVISAGKKENKTDAASKINRRNNIIRLIREKGEVMIKDISSVISDCSEKTIQRELNTLVAEHVLKRAGAKRWSRYMIANS